MAGQRRVGTGQLFGWTLVHMGRSDCDAELRDEAAAMSCVVRSEKHGITVGPGELGSQPAVLD